MATKTVFQMDGAGLFAGTTYADESPLEPGKYHLPRGCVQMQPDGLTLLADAEGNVTGWEGQWPADKWPRWRTDGWELIPRPIIPAQAEAQEKEDPVAKLRAFLDANPDVAQLLAPAQT